MLKYPTEILRSGSSLSSTRPDQGVGRLLINGKPSGNIPIKAYPLFSGGKFAIGRYASSPITKETGTKDYFRL